MKKIFLLMLFICEPFLFSYTIQEAYLENNSSFVVITDEGRYLLNVSPRLSDGERRKFSFSLVSSGHKKDDFSVTLVGLAEGLADVIISEFDTKIQKGKDKVELYVLKSGTLKGITVEGSEDKFVFGDVLVNKGDYVVAELNLKNSKGFISVKSSNSETAKILDRVLYSLGTIYVENSRNFSGQAINIKDSTATRSVNRKKNNFGDYIDTNSASDFYITVTRGASFGSENNPKVYEK